MGSPEISSYPESSENPATVFCESPLFGRIRKLQLICHEAVEDASIPGNLICFVEVVPRQLCLWLLKGFAVASHDGGKLTSGESPLPNGEGQRRRVHLIECSPIV